MHKTALQGQQHKPVIRRIKFDRKLGFRRRGLKPFFVSVYRTERLALGSRS